MNSICKLKDIYKALHEFEASFLKQYGITVNEGIILCMLGDGPLKVGDICADCSLSNSRLSKVLGSLEKKGYVQRTIDPNDRRVVMVELTPIGIEKRSTMSEEQVCIPDALSKLLEK
ncbi:MarR family winged helix-turn-helix transcriptional regulator [Acetobacteroides hydrogenigenes]|uniref:DNA-binding MarR family transcriptional regulator n=1 Tax=Acetobacteroides hydrogenigenes TaxID=979970 RepID=A0A4R2ETH2_9BACT|nr:winged helix DNA-binding protein [Acetobacteroides hydrogenigenes]TCN70064.1 DNA-binding MarR family transcriptional regulator [Acetobacteroides hydrogenigenes]